MKKEKKKKKKQKLLYNDINANSPNHVQCVTVSLSLFLFDCLSIPSAHTHIMTAFYFFYQNKRHTANRRININNTVKEPIQTHWIYTNSSKLGRFYFSFSRFSLSFGLNFSIVWKSCVRDAWMLNRVRTNRKQFHFDNKQYNTLTTFALFCAKKKKYTKTKKDTLQNRQRTYTHTTTPFVLSECKFIFVSLSWFSFFFWCISSQSFPFVWWIFLL